MQILSAIDAISPAWVHTRRLLWDKRDWRLLLKIGAVAVFAEMGGCNSDFNAPMNKIGGTHPAVMAALMAVLVLAGIALLFIGLALFYIGSRLQFVLFDVVLRSDTTVAPIWRRFGSVTWRWVGLKLLLILAAVLCVTPFLIPLILHFVHAAGASGHIANPFSFILTIVVFILIIFVIAIAFGVSSVLLRDFGIPSMALENTTLKLTVQRIIRLVHAEPGQVALYLVMGFVLRMAGVMVCYLILLIALLIAAVPFGGAGLGLWLTLRHASVAGHIAMIAGWVVLGLILAALFFIAAIILMGYVLTFQQAYALYFLGGRYPMLGAYLESSMPPPGYAYAAPLTYPAAGYSNPEPATPASPQPPPEPEPHS